MHRRFVQAVEQLGVDKAVPSRILELMGIDYLTRHNIASHLQVNPALNKSLSYIIVPQLPDTSFFVVLQKYRSHRKHMLAREAEAASWSQRRQIYSTPPAGGSKREVTPWPTPTLGFPPPAQAFRPPLHVWGHPTVDHSMVHMWPKQPVPSRSTPSPPWTTPHPPPPDSSYWHHPHYRRVSFLSRTLFLLSRKLLYQAMKNDVVCTGHERGMGS